MTKKPFNMFKELATDTDSEVTGVWVSPWGPVEDGFPSFRIARAGGANIAYDKALTTILAPSQRLIQAQAKKPGDQVLRLVREASMEAFAKACIKGWKNVTNAKGETIDWSPDAALTLCKQLPEAYTALVEEANNVTMFRVMDAEDDSKNS